MTALVAGVSPGWNALLNVEDQGLGAIGPVALSVLADNFLCERERAILGVLRFFWLASVL